MDSPAKPSSPEEGKNLDQIKIVLLGDQSVGKTSIITRYLKDTFAEDYSVSLFFIE